jgi:hypothetical protein
MTLTTFAIGKDADPDETLLRMVKENQIEKKLRESGVFKDCAEKSKETGGEIKGRIDATSACIQKEIQGLSKAKSEQLLETLNLSGTELYGDKNQEYLSNYISNLVKKSLYGEHHEKPGVLEKVDQEMFTLIYESVVGKALFTELAQYCLEKKGIKTISEIVQKTKDETETDIGSCIGSIKTSCEITDNAVKDAKGCLFRKRLVEFKTVLSKIKEDKQTWEEVRRDSKNYLQLSNLDKNLGANKTSGQIAKELTSISSEDLVQEGYQEKSKNLSDQADQMRDTCLRDLNDKSCEKFFNKGTHESLGEYRLQRELELDLKIRRLQESSLGALKDEARKSNYFSEEELKTLLEKSESEIRAMIELKYKEERLALQKDIDDRIADIGIKRTEDLKTLADTKVKRIHELLQNKPEELKAITFFSHIVARVGFKEENKEGRILSGIDEEIRALEKKTDDPDTKKALTYLENFKRDQEGSQDNEHLVIKFDAIDSLLFGEK